MSGYVEFEFDLPGALLTSLVQLLDNMNASALSSDELKQVPEAQGVYQLFLDGRLVYVGKTDADAGLHKRLTRHAKKILHRRNLDPSRVSFKAVRVFVFTAMDLESELIKHYGGVKNLGWNGSGFGSNDPGRERDTTAVKSDNYDALFPIDVDREIPFAVDEGELVADALARLKDALPYTFRFESNAPRSRQAHADLSEAIVKTKLSGPTTPRKAVAHLISFLPAGWQATCLPGYIIMYKESRSYPQASVIATSYGSED